MLPLPASSGRSAWGSVNDMRDARFVIVHCGLLPRPCGMRTVSRGDVVNPVAVKVRASLSQLVSGHRPRTWALQWTEAKDGQGNSATRSPVIREHLSSFSLRLAYSCRLERGPRF